MERSIDKKYASIHPLMEKAGKLISRIVKMAVIAIVIFTVYQQFFN